MSIFRKNPIIFFLTILVMLLLPTGCFSQVFAEPTPTNTAYPTIRPPKPTRTPTTTPTATPLPTYTPTTSPTPTLPPPPDDFSKARVYASGPQEGWNFSITILLPEAVMGEYNAIVGETEKAFTCRPLTDYAHPDRLFCIGRIPAADKQVEFTIFEKSTGQQVFTGNVYAPIP